MKTTLRPALLATAAILGLGSLAAMAATTAPVPGAAMPMTQAAPATSAPPQSMTERVNHHIATLHTELQITPAETPQWNHFAAVMRANAQTMDRNMHQRMDKLPNMNAEQNMRSYMMIANAHAQGMRNLLPAFEHLYQKMSPAQKQTADELFRNQAYRGKQARKG